LNRSSETRQCTKVNISWKCMTSGDLLPIREFQNVVKYFVLLFVYLLITISINNNRLTVAMLITTNRCALPQTSLSVGGETHSHIQRPSAPHSSRLRHTDLRPQLLNPVTANAYSWTAARTNMLNVNAKTVTRQKTYTNVLFDTLALPIFVKVNGPPAI